MRVSSLNKFKLLINNKPMQEERFKMPVASHLLLMRENEILLHLRKNSSFEGLYSVIAGHLNGGESATEAMIREAKEEAGIDISREDLKVATVSHSNANNRELVQFFFICNKWSGEITNMEPDKCGELKFFSLDNLPENIVPYIKKGIECALGGVSYYEFGWEKYS